jgi:hypothetical protein
LGWFPAQLSLGNLRSVVDDVLDFGMDAIAKVASMALARGQKLARLFGRLGLNAPFLDAGHNYIGVKYFAFALDGDGWHGTSPSNQFARL